MSRSEQILNFMRERKSAGSSEVAAALGLSKDEVAPLMSKLRAMGKLRIAGRTRAKNSWPEYLYEIVDLPEQGVGLPGLQPHRRRPASRGRQRSAGSGVIADRITIGRGYRWWSEST